MGVLTHQSRAASLEGCSQQRRLLGLGRTRAGSPFVLPIIATRTSHLGNLGQEEAAE